MKANQKIKVGTVIFGAINSYPPAHWRVWKRTANTVRLENIKPRSQSTAYPDQQIAVDEITDSMISE